MRFERPDEAPYYLNTGEENPVYESSVDRFMEALDERPSLATARRAQAHPSSPRDRAARRTPPGPTQEAS